MGRRALVARLLLMLGLAALLTVGCSALTGGPGTPEGKEREQFSARRESADGAIVEWGGYVEGYEAGAEATFDVSIKNETGEAWEGRLCLQLMSGTSPQVIATLEQRPFRLEPGVGFSDTLTVALPETLDEGACGLSLVVRRAGGPMVDLVPIQVGDSDEERGATTQEDMDAALEACAPVGRDGGDADALVELAKEKLAERLDIDTEEITVEAVQEATFPDASLGVPEPGKSYAQVVTPGYVIRLEAEGETYEYHGANERVVLAVGE